MIAQKAQRCSSLPDIAFGRMSTLDTSVGSEVEFECNAGYALVGHQRITCTQIGVWNGMPPVCFRKLGLTMMIHSIYNCS